MKVSGLCLFVCFRYAYDSMWLHLRKKRQKRKKEKKIKTLQTNSKKGIEIAITTDLVTSLFCFFFFMFSAETQQIVLIVANIFE